MDGFVCGYFRIMLRSAKMLELRGLEEFANSAVYVLEFVIIERGPSASLNSITSPCAANMPVLTEYPLPLFTSPLINLYAENFLMYR
jgi:hypothetical protein